MFYNVIKLDTMPSIVFAHVYHCVNYKVSFKPMKPNIEIAYIETGNLKLIFGDEEIMVPEKSFLILPHKYEFVLKSIENEPHIHYTASAMVNSEQTVSATIPETSLSDELCIPLCIEECDKTKEMVRLLNSIIKEYQNDDTLSRNKCGALFAQLLCEAADTLNIKVSNHISSTAEVLDRRIKKYIDKSINEKITLSDIAICLGKNANYLNQVFRKKNGMSIISYVNQMKIKRAAVLITEENLSLKEAAEKIGISDANYLSRLFKTKMGMTVSEFKSNSVYNTFGLNDWEKIFKKNQDNK